MNARHDLEPGSSEHEEHQVQQQTPSSGEGSGSAMDAMVRKRRAGENHVEEDERDRVDRHPDEAAQEK